MEGKPRVVVLDDNEVYAALMAAALEEDFEVAVGHNGLQGIALCLEARPAALVTDIGMPEFDAIQMLGEFAKNPALNTIPVVVVTATHFTRLSRDAVARYPQVTGIFSKTDDVCAIADEVRRIVRR